MVRGSPQHRDVDGSALLWDLLVRRAGLHQGSGIPMGLVQPIPGAGCAHCHQDLVLNSHGHGGPVKPWAVDLPQVSGNPLAVAEGGKGCWTDPIAQG